MNGIDLAYRPATYFRPQKLEQYLLSKVKGAVLKRNLKSMFSQGLHEEAKAIVLGLGVDLNEYSKGMESVHPMFMGRNYLPEFSEDEVEIARIRVNSTTYDVSCVYAEPRKV